MSFPIASTARAPERLASVVPRSAGQRNFSRWHALCLLAALSAFLSFYGISAGELYRTESLRAIIAAQFLHSSNWIVPTLYHEPLFTKPPGMYAAIALLSWPLGGVQDWTARLPSALAAVATMFLFYSYFSRCFGRRAGLVAAAILPMSLMWLDKATSAEIDMLQVGWISAALLFFLRALEAEETDEQLQKDANTTTIIAFRVTLPSDAVLPPEATAPVPALSPTGQATTRSFPWWLAALLCVAAGVLTKWTAPAFFYGSVVPLLVWRRRGRLLWSRQHLLSAALAAGICLAWIAAAVYQTGWQVFYDTVSREALMRLSPTHHHRPYPWLESLIHPLKVFASSLPWSFVALLTLRSGFLCRWDDKGKRLVQALHCWLWPNLLFWSVIPEHASRHSFPMFPALAGLAAMVWIDWMREPRQKEKRLAPLFRPTVVLLTIVGAWLLLKVTFVHFVIPARNINREPRAKGEFLASLVPSGQTLYLSRLKDEGIMFYYGRDVCRLQSFAHLPSSAEPVYCILDESEWRTWPAARPAEVVQHLYDEQGAPIVLVRLRPLSKGLGDGSRGHS
jgi:4-amino-4-deoxy-L-arabinose transferase-like glycosyltransferase